MEDDDTGELICALCANSYPADENFYVPYCSAECLEDAEEFHARGGPQRVRGEEGSSR